ncbi:MAG: hypothetical protein QOJ09_2990 [Actinomycetota bacterium]|nr:hypothetical protein [Actinomycetota bacterium]
MRTGRRIALLVLGPLAIGALRLVLPYDTSDSAAVMVAKAYAHPARESAVLWLLMLGLLTLVPGVLVVLSRTRGSQPRLTTWAGVLVVPAYLCLGGPAATDLLVWSAQQANLPQAQAVALVSHVHATVGLQLAVFVVGHVVGTVLLGLAVLRSGVAPAPAAWALVVSQPLHFVAAVVLGSHALDLFAWCLTAVGMACVSASTSFGANRVEGRTGHGERIARVPAHPFPASVGTDRKASL